MDSSINSLTSLLIVFPSCLASLPIFFFISSSIQTTSQVCAAIKSPRVKDIEPSLTGKTEAAHSPGIAQEGPSLPNISPS
jgi:hypothetical protein